MEVLWSVCAQPRDLMDDALARAGVLEYSWVVKHDMIFETAVLIALAGASSCRIHSSSGHTAAFKPELIAHDNPADQSSRWTSATSKPGDDARASSSGPGAAGSSVGQSSAASTSPSSGVTLHPSQPRSKRRKRDSQYITLELPTPAIVTAIGFGKYQK